MNDELEQAEQELAALDELLQMAENNVIVDPALAKKQQSVAQAAAQSLPGNFQYSEVRPVILTSEGGRNYGCYEFRGSGETGETVTIYIDADSGRERRIEVSRTASF